MRERQDGLSFTFYKTTRSILFLYFCGDDKFGTTDKTSFLLQFDVLYRIARAIVAKSQHRPYPIQFFADGIHDLGVSRLAGDYALSTYYQYGAFISCFVYYSPQHSVGYRIFLLPAQ